MGPVVPRPGSASGRGGASTSSSPSSHPPEWSLDEVYEPCEPTTEYEVEHPLNPYEDLVVIDTEHSKSNKMDCGICQKNLTQEDGPNCVGCVRSMLYPIRLELARVLLEKEAMGKKVEAIVAEDEPEEPLDNELAILRRAYQQQFEADEVQQIEEENSETERELAIAQKELELKQEKSKQLKELLDKRRANLAAAKEAERKNQAKKREELKVKSAQLKADHDIIHNKVIDAKAVLCREAASLLGLRRVKKKIKDGSIKDCYMIAQLPLPDLKDINILDSTARLVHLCAYYLGVRLPAEITLPHRDYPLPTINSPQTSYFGHRTAFPGTGSSLSAPSSPTGSRVDVSSFPRPRPLFIGSFDVNEIVAQYAKKEPVAFNFFLEGISLLAWDIAWLCRTQGFVHGTELWDDVCDIGRNLCQMIVAVPQSPATFRTLTQRDLQIRQRRPHSTSSPASDSHMMVGRLGSGSHTSAHTFLGSAAAAGDNPSRNWRLNKYNMVVDPLKKHLLGEMNTAEWELLEEPEWDDGGEKMDDAVVIRTRAMDGKDYDESRKVVGAGEDGGKGKGTSGWTKVKSR
ncbi:hypothetical protein LTR99_000458 [Exophiala xenobiotica]|nr:hypothetical protein LTR99_000458 [Exophiala xenobiotica]KAK5439489.1 hypothetical protein LTR34_000457 [Exophiala xenobiotica]